MIAALRANIAATIFGGLAAIFAIIAVIQTVKLNGFLWIDGALDKVENLTRDNNELRAELKAISSKKNEQKVETGKRIERAEKNEREGRVIVERIRNAPIVEGKCETPGLEILRNEI